MNVVLKDNGEIRLEGFFKKDIGVALVTSVREKLPKRPDRSSNAWCDWDTRPGHCEPRIFFPFAEWSKWLDVIKPDLDALGADTYQHVKAQLEAL